MSHTSLPADTILRVEGLSVDFPLRERVLHAVRDASFSLTRSSTLCLVGESGSGKSVTARAVMRITDAPGRQIAGRILLEHNGGTLDLASLPAKSHQIRAIRGARIGFIFQEPMSALSPLYTIGAQIDEVTQLHLRLDKEQARARTVDLLRQVEIPDPERMANRYSFEFSGGMRQRACIAMALACNPDILIADEPTTALDVTTQAEILDLIKRLQTERGMSMLLITHDMGIVAEVAETVAVMQDGYIVEQGPVDDIFHNPQHAYTRRLLAATVKLERAAAQRLESQRQRADAKPILSVRGLGKAFGLSGAMLPRRGQVLKAVDDVNLDLYPGENLGIVGESGSGKTTLGRLILRVLEPSAGTITYRDSSGSELDVGTLNRAGLKRFHSEVRLVFQDPFGSLNPRMTVKRIVGDPLYINRIASGRELERRVGELLELVGLDRSAMERYPHAFSGGQRQRIGIARALALDPRVIIADEATSALDVSIRSQILDLLFDVQKRLGLSFIFIAHDISVVRYFCDRVVVMHRGRIVEIGDADVICTTPSEPYTKALISAVPNPDPRHKRMLHRVRFDA